MLQSLSRPEVVELFHKLETTSVYDLSPSERVTLLLTFCDAVMSQPDGRQVLDEAFDEIKNSKTEHYQLIREESQRKGKHKLTIQQLMKEKKELMIKEKEKTPFFRRDQTSVQNLTH